MVQKVKIFKVRQDKNRWRAWNRLMVILKEKGYESYEKAQKADISIVLSGQRENPVALTGKKVLAYNSSEWEDLFFIYKPILDEYYDDMIDLTGLTVFQAAEKIIRYIEGK